jgi:hypothetical protein
MLRRVAVVRTDVSEELNASIIRVTRIGEVGTTLAVTSSRSTLLCLSARAISFGSSYPDHVRPRSYPGLARFGCHGSFQQVDPALGHGPMAGSARPVDPARGVLTADHLKACYLQPQCVHQEDTPHTTPHEWSS